MQLRIGIKDPRRHLRAIEIPFPYSDISNIMWRLHLQDCGWAKFDRYYITSMEGTPKREHLSDYSCSTIMMFLLVV